MHSDIPKNILLLFITIVVFLIIFEGILFIGGFLKEEEKINPSFELHHVNTPFIDLEFKTDEWVVREKINSIGLRDYEIVAKSDKKRMLMLGDSFTFGYGVELEDTFTKQLEKLGDYEVINTGVVSYSPILEYLYLKNEGLKLNPDIVILNFDMSDVVDDYRYNSSAIYENNEIIGFDLGKTDKERKLVNIFMKSNIIKFIKPKFEILLQFLFKNTIVKEDETPDINRDRYIILRDNLDLDSYLALTLNYIKKINELCKDNDIEFILHVYPYAVQVDGNEWDKGRTKWGFAVGKTYTTKPFLILESFSNENNIIFVSGLEEFRQSKNKPLFFSYDGHFNKKGHLLVADYIYESLINNNLV